MIGVVVMNYDFLNLSTSVLNKIIAKNFYKNLTLLLKKKNISKEQLTTDLNISKKTLWTYSQELNAPSLSTAMKIAAYLDVSIYELSLPNELLKKENTTNDNNHNFEKNTIDYLLKIITLLEKEDKNEKN